MNLRAAIKITVSVLVPALVQPALAQVHAGDILLSIDNSAIHTGLLAEDGVTVTPGIRVFVSTLGVDFPNYASEPGFDCEPGTFGVGTSNTFRIMDSLRYWDGSDFSIPSSSRLEIAYAGLFSRTTPDSPSIVEGFPLAVGSNGQWHRHLEFTLDDPASDGVYLLSLRIASSDPTLTETDTFYILFSQNAPADELQTASDWVTSNLLGPGCQTDYNNDGTADVADILDLASDIASGTASFPPSNPDFNADGSADLSDLFDLANAIAGAGCP